VCDAIIHHSSYSQVDQVILYSIEQRSKLVNFVFPTKPTFLVRSNLKSERVKKKGFAPFLHVQNLKFEQPMDFREV
jgi:hypothetical protein